MKKDNIDAQARAIVDRLGPPPLEMLEREIERLERTGAYKKLALGCLTTLVVAAAVIVLLTHLWLGVVQIDGTGMTPQLRPGGAVLTVKMGSPAQKDVISFYYNNKIYVKRVIGTAGDWIDINADGIVTVNGKILDEPYVSKPALGECEIALPCLVPAGTMFVMGDNRSVSEDSRGKLGTIDAEAVAGKVILRIWPLSQLGKVK